MLRLDWRLAPYQVAVLPLSKKEELEATSREVLAALQPHFMCDYDVTQSIGRRYRRQDEVGTPWCVTVDFDSLEDRAVTVRDRDTTDPGPRPHRRPRGRAARPHRARLTPTKGGGQRTRRNLRIDSGAMTRTITRLIPAAQSAWRGWIVGQPIISPRAALATWLTGW